MKKIGLLLMLFLVLLAAPAAAQKNDKPAPTAQEQSVIVLLKNKTLQLQNIKVGDKIQILNILGVRVMEKKADSTNVDIQLDLPQGYYIVKVGTAVRKISVK